MKLKSYNILFRIFSFLSDKTNGAPFFVKYKLLLGTLILGVVSGASAKAQKKVTTIDTVSSLKPVPAEITCYKPARQDSFTSTSDNIEIKANIRDNIGDEIVGAVITIKNSSRATVTDLQGNFTIKAGANDTLIFSMVGFQTLEVPVAKMKNDTVIIMKDANIELSCYMVVSIKEKPIISPTESIKIDSVRPIDLNEISPEGLTGIMCYGIVVNPYDNDDIYKRITKEDKFSYDRVLKKPTSPYGDLDAFKEWIEKNIRYTEQMRRDKVQGEVVLSFAIDKKGKVVDKKVISKLSKEADKEALRVLSSSERWNPGWHRNPVKTTITITINFDYK